MQRFKDHDFSNFVFVDGKILYNKKGSQRWGKYAWQDRSKRPFKRAVNRSSKNGFHVYAGVCKKGKSPLIKVPMVTGEDPQQRFKSKDACKALLKIKQWCDGIYKGQPYQIIVDHARQHYSKEATRFVIDNNIPIWKEFPAQSPDLNIIENVWKFLRDGLDMRRPSSLGGFKRACQQEWSKIDQQAINNCINSIPQRMERIKQQGGAWMLQQSTK